MALMRGGLLWLLAQEGRVLWRGSLLVRSRRFVLAPVLLVALVFQGGALVLARVILRHPLPAPEMILAANLNLVFLGVLMFSRAITAAIDVLYGRGDVDFLLAAPVPPGRVLAARMLGVAVSVAAPWLLLGGVLANGLLVQGQVWALALLPMLAALGLLAAAAAFALVVLLVGFMPPGRARRVGQMASLAAGLVIFALGQAPRVVAPAVMARLWRGMMPGPDLRGLAWVPGRAALGAPAPLLGCVGVSVALFLLVWVALAGRFASGAVSAAAYRSGGRASGRAARFRRGAFMAALDLNARLLARFPGLGTQVVYRALALVPVLMILAGPGRGGGTGVVAPLLVFLAGQLALFFVSVLVGSDQAPELAAAAPVTAGLRDGARLVCAGAAVVAVLALPVAGVAWRAAWLLPVLLPGVAAAVAANAALGLRLPIPLVRGGFGKAGGGTVLGLVLGVAVSGGLAGMVWLGVVLRR